MSTQRPADESVDPGGGAASNAGFSLLAHLVSGAFTAGLIVFLARALGPQDYGIFTLSIAIGVLLLRPTDFGLSSATARFIAERRGEPAAVARILADALVLRLGLNLLGLAAILALAGVIAGWLDEPELTGPLRVVALALVGQSTMLLFAAAFVAVGRTSRKLSLYASEGAIEATASVLLVLAGAGVGGAAAGRTIGYLAGALIGFALAVRLLGRPRSGDPEVPARRRLGRLARYGGVLLLVDSTFTLFNQVGTLVIGAVLGSAAVGLYSAPLQLCVFLHNGGLAISDGVSPRLARHRSRPTDVRAFRAALRLLVLLQLALAVPILVWAEPIVALLLGSDFAASADVLRVLAAFVFVQGFGPLLSGAANFRGLAGRRVPIVIGAVMITLLLNVLLVPRIGILGAAIGTTVGYSAYVAAHLELCRRSLGMSLGPLGKTLARGLVAAAAMAAVLLLVGTREVGIPGLVVGGAGGALAFVAVLLATHELTREELSTARAALVGRLGRR